MKFSTLLLHQKTIITMSLIAFFLAHIPRDVLNLSIAPNAAAAQTPDTHAPRLSDEELAAYTRAKPRVDEINLFWDRPLQNASATAADGLRQVRDNELAQSLKSTGLSLERYRQIELQVQMDLRLENEGKP